MKIKDWRFWLDYFIWSKFRRLESWLRGEKLTADTVSTEQSLGEE